MAMTPAPVPNPAAMSATALARSAEAVCSAAVTCASPFVALSRGRPAAEAVGQANDGKRAQRRQAHNGQSDTQVGARQPGLVGQGCAVVHLAEPPGHVAEGGYHAELPEPRGEGGDSHTDHGPVVPPVQAQPAGRGAGTVPGSALNVACTASELVAGALPSPVWPD